VGRKNVRAYISPLLAASGETIGWVATMSAMYKMNDYLMALFTIYGLTIPIALVFTIIGVTYAANKITQPIKSITEFVHNFRSTNLGKYVPVL